MTIALITLAMLQYQWLGSVSEAEKDRLKENLTASTENFVSDFNQVFSDLGETFRIQVSNPLENLALKIDGSYNTWINNSPYPELIDSVYFIKKESEDEVAVFLYSPKLSTINKVLPSKSVKKWLDDEFNESKKGNKTLHTTNYPSLATPSFYSVPLQKLDMIQISKGNNSGQGFEVQLSVNQIEDRVLLQLNDELIKEEIIPSIAKLYFSGSYEDQYNLTILNDAEERKIYFTSAEVDNIPKPDVKSYLNHFRVNSIMMFKTDLDDAVLNPIMPSILSDSLKMKLLDFKDDASDSVMKSNSHIEMHTIATSSYSSKTRTNNVEWEFRGDTSRSTFTSASISGSTWELWLSFKEGSLDAFVNKTRIKNLIISFGILGILGISIGLIAVFSQKSRELAEQQMLFVAGVSHELRTPITVIRSAAENLREGFVKDEHKRNQYAQLMVKEGKRLSDMVDQIMEFSGIQSGKRVYHFTTVNILELIESIIEESRHLLDEKGMQLEYSILTKKENMLVDPDAIFLSVINLINNAVKFSGESEKILLKVEEHTYKGTMTVRIQVQDFGIGIPIEEQSDIFKPFFRGKKPISNQVKGNGIGLSLVEKVARAHKGVIQLKSKVGEGSTFSLILPLERNNVG